MPITAVWPVGVACTFSLTLFLAGGAELVAFMTQSPERLHPALAVGLMLVGLIGLVLWGLVEVL